MNKDVAFIKEAKRRYGKDPHQLTNLEFTHVALRVRSPAEAAIDAAKVAGSVVKTEVLGKRVPLQIFEERRDKCQEPCKYYLVLADGEPGCLKCQCSGGRRVRAKWNDPDTACPIGKWGKYRAKPS